MSGYNAPDLSDEYGILSSSPNGIPDYIDEVAIMADYVRNVMINEFDFLPEIDDGDGIYDIYIKNKSSYNYGINIPDNEIMGASYIEIDNKYEEGSYYTSGINTMKLTLAHEFFHAIQRAYNSPAFGHTFFWEMSATFIEDIFVPEGNDYIFWVDSFFENSNMNISSTDGYSIALFGHYLKNQIADGDIGIIRKMWENYSNINDPFYAMKNVLENDYNVNFQYIWSDFVSRNLYNSLYQDMNNNFYFHIDQKDIVSLALNFDSPTLINNSMFVNNILINQQSANNNVYTVNNLSVINLDYLTSGQIEGFVSILSQNINFNKHIYINDNTNEIYINENDLLFLTHSLHNTGYLNFEINLSSPDISLGDCNLDQSLNVLDVVSLIEYIISENYQNQLEYINADINTDNNLNIYDLVLLVEIILNTR